MFSQLSQEMNIPSEIIKIAMNTNSNDFKGLVTVAQNGLQNEKGEGIEKQVGRNGVAAAAVVVVLL